MKPAAILLLSGISLAFSFVSSGQALTWVETEEAAMWQASSAGKRVLLLAGRHTCGNCNYTQNTLCEMSSPAIKQLIQQGYVPWFCDIDASSQWRPYASGLSSFTLPLLCCIDPAKPGTYLDRTTGVQNADTFYVRLMSHLPAASPRITACGIQNGQLRIALGTLPAGKTNVVERSTDLKVWTTAGTVSGTGAEASWSEELSATPGPVYYRFKTLP